jgi:hypothetical protein
VKVVHVQWRDPGFAQTGWMFKSEFETWVKKDIARSNSVGLLAYETETYIMLVQSVGEDQVADALKISRAAIESIKEVAELTIKLEIE